MNPKDRNYCVATDVAFLLDMARHFEKRSSNGEDSEHWANVHNAQNCRRIASLLSPIDQGEAKHRAQEAAGEVWERGADAQGEAGARTFNDCTFDWTLDERTVAAVIDWYEEQYPYSIGHELARKHFLPKKPDRAEELVREWGATLRVGEYVGNPEEVARAFARWLLSRGEIK